MKTKTIKDKNIYGGLFVDKYFLTFEDDTSIQVPVEEWEQYAIGDVYVERYPQTTKWPRVDCSNISRLKALGWLWGQAMSGIPEAVKLEEEFSRIQKLAYKYGAPKEEIFKK